MAPTIDTTAYSIRFAGANRYQTNLSTNLALRGKGGYPFSTPDPTSGAWGVGICPRSIIVVAGDVFADALAAASLSDPTDRSSQPRLTVAASSDPTFIPVGTVDRPDTAYAPIVVTQSARQGATGLSDTARSTAADFNHIGCSTAKQAIIVGGGGSVPSGVAQELVSLGYDEVFRVAGTDRYDTAAKVALALGVGNGSNAGTCLDPDVTDGSARMGWYGNAVAEFRDGPKSCVLLPRAVVLADGGSGADALAAGWWTSFWQVPVLLTASDGSLPAATQDALRTLHPTALIVLGGVSRIPEATVNDAAKLAGDAIPGRVGGNDRYETSVLMAEEFGGWWPTSHAADFAGSLVCLAASGADSGWPDALSAGPWCASASGGAADPGQPGRLLPPLDVSSAIQIDGHVRPAHDAVPIILVPSASSATSAVTSYLTSVFPRTEPWCSSTAVGVCVPAGFAVAFGGTAAVGSSALADITNAVSGSRYPPPQSDDSPRIDAPFITDLDMTPVFTSGSQAGAEACTSRGGLSAARWIVANGNHPSTVADLAGHPPFGADADGVTRSLTASVPFCWAIPASLDLPSVLGLRAVSPSGHTSRDAIAGGDWLKLGAPISVEGPTSTTGLSSTVDPASGGTTTWTFSKSALSGVTVVSKNEIASVNDFVATLRLDRGSAADAPDIVSGALTLITTRGAVSGSFRGEALFVSGTWRLRGRITWSGGTWNVQTGSGGFAANIQSAGAGTNSVDVLTWDSDGVVR